MKILALNGSRRKNGNTAALVDAVLGAAAADGAATEALFLGDYNIGACTGCEGCSNSWECVIKDDFQPLVARMDAADGVVFASPTYWYSVTSDMKRLIDRCYSLIRFPVSRKEWISKYAGSGRAAVVVAVCEQETEDMMGNTLQLLNDFAGDIGLPVAATVRGLQHFAA
ncbi:MAG: flavodoxin family protein, partial [Desulfuromonadales bacterium]|nr:flavodoxin family protein [Desulfuromonadales bacterium]